MLPTHKLRFDTSSQAQFFAGIVDLNFNRKILIFFGILFLMGVILEIWTANRLATLGSKINQISQVKSSLELENQILEVKIAQDLSLQKNEVLAKALGFVPTKQFEYFPADSVVKISP